MFCPASPIFFVVLFKNSVGKMPVSQRHQTSGDFEERDHACIYCSPQVIDVIRNSLTGRSFSKF